MRDHGYSRWKGKEKERGRKKDSSPPLPVSVTVFVNVHIESDLLDCGTQKKVRRVSRHADPLRPDPNFSNVWTNPEWGFVRVRTVDDIYLFL